MKISESSMVSAILATCKEEGIFAMSVFAAALWYFVIFDADGGLVTTPMPFESDEQCQTAMAEFQANYPSSTWDIECIAPDN